jgi:hypothetical protein
MIVFHPKIKFSAFFSSHAKVLGDVSPLFASINYSMRNIFYKTHTKEDDDFFSRNICAAFDQGKKERFRRNE